MRWHLFQPVLFPERFQPQKKQEKDGDSGL
jgi:hypothetical protein